MICIFIHFIGDTEWFSKMTEPTAHEFQLLMLFPTLDILFLISVILVCMYYYYGIILICIFFWFPKISIFLLMYLFSCINHTCNTFSRIPSFSFFTIYPCRLFRNNSLYLLILCPYIVPPSLLSLLVTFNLFFISWSCFFLLYSLVWIF